MKLKLNFPVCIKNNAHVIKYADPLKIKINSASRKHNVYQVIISVTVVTRSAVKQYQSHEVCKITRSCLDRQYTFPRLRMAL